MPTYSSPSPTPLLPSFALPHPLLSPLLLPLLLLLLLLSPSLSSACDPSDLTCSTCPTSSSHANSIHSLPRVTSSAHSTSANLGAYTWYTCDPSGLSCQSYFDTSDPPSSSLSPNHSPSSPDNYTQSLLAYTTFALACALLCTAAILTLFTLRYCTHTATGGLVGNRWPTARPEGKATLTSPLIGYAEQPGGGELRYPTWERWAARLFMLLSVALLWAWVAVGWWAGGKDLQGQLGNVVESPQPLMAAVQQTGGGVGVFVQSLGDEVLAGLVDNVTRQLTADVDLPALVSQLGNISGRVQALPTVDALQGVFTALQGSTSAITATLSAAIPPFTAGFSNLSTVDSLTSAIAASSSTYVSTSVPLPTILAWVSSNTTTLVRFCNLLQSGSSTDTIPVIAAGLTDYSAVPSISAVANLTSALTLLINSSATSFPASSRLPLLSQLNSLYSALQTVPPYSSISAEMGIYNSYAGVILTYGSALNSYTFMTQATAIINTLTPQLTSLLSNYTALTPYLSPATFNYTAQVALLQAMNATLAQLPSLAALTSAIQVIPNLASVIPLLSAAASPLSIFTSQYLSLPNASTLIPLYISLLNSSLPAAEAQFSLAQTQMQTFLTSAQTLNSSNAAGLQGLAPLTSTLSTLSATSPSSFVAYIPTLLQAFASLNFTSTIPALQALQAALVPSIFSLSTVTAYASVGSNIGAIEQFVLANNADIAAWSHGYCQTSTSTLCASSTDCPSNSSCLNIGVKRCAANPSTPCNTTSACPSGDRCLIDATTYTAFVGLLNSLWQSGPSVALNAQLLASMSNVSAAIAAVQPFAWQAPVSAALPVIAATPSAAALANSSAAAVAVVSSYNSSLTTAAYSSLLQSVQSINYTAAFTAVQLVNASLSRLSQGNYSQQLQQTGAVLSVLSTFLYTVWPANISASLAPAYLSSLAQQDDGLVALSTSLALTLTSLTSFLATSPALSVLAVDGLAQTTTIRAYLHLLYSSSISQYGAFHYFASLFDRFTNASRIINASLTPQNRWDVDPSGAVYPDARVCMTDTCLHNSIDWYYTQPLSTTTSHSVHVAPQTVTGPLLLLPFLLGALGLASLLAWRSYPCSKALASLTACLTFCAVPLLFILAGFAFPLAMLHGDVCYGGANVGYQYVQAKQDAACTSFLGGSGTATDCVVGIDSLNATVDIAALLHTVATGQCAPGTANAFDALFASLSSSATTWPATRVATVASALSNSSAIIIQPTLHTLLTTTASNASTHLLGLISTLNSTLSCDRLQTDLLSIQSSFCCSLASSTFWALSVWFLLAFTLCCCQGPAAVMGRKRFAERLVGARLAPGGERYDPYGEYREGEGEGGMEEGGGGGVDGWRRVLKLLGLGVAVMAKEKGSMGGEKGVGAGDEMEMTLQSPKPHDHLLHGRSAHSYPWTLPHRRSKEEEEVEAGEGGDSPQQCVVCLQAKAAQRAVGGCGHVVCVGCLRQHVQRQVGTHRYPILCPLSLLTQQGRPACDEPLTDADVYPLLSPDDRDAYQQMQRIHGAISPSTSPPSTTPSPSRSPARTPTPTPPPILLPPPPPTPIHTPGTPLPHLKDILLPPRDRYRPLPSSRTSSSHLTPDANPHAFINTAGGSIHVLQHPHSDFARTGTLGGTGGTGGTWQGPVVIHGMVGGGEGGGLGLGRTMEGDERVEGGVKVGGRRVCPIDGCGGGGVVGGEGGVQVQCERCGYVWCVACDTPWHAHMTCEEFQMWRRRALEREVEMYRAEQQQQRDTQAEERAAGGGGGGMEEVREEEEREEAQEVEEPPEHGSLPSYRYD